MTEKAEKAPTKKIAPVPEGQRRVRIVYSRDNTLMGKVVDFPAAEAKVLVAENRVKYVPDDTPLDAEFDDATVADIQGTLTTPAEDMAGAAPVPAVPEADAAAPVKAAAGKAEAAAAKADTAKADTAAAKAPAGDGSK